MISKSSASRLFMARSLMSAQVPTSLPAVVDDDDDDDDLSSCVQVALMQSSSFSHIPPAGSSPVRTQYFGFDNEKRDTLLVGSGRHRMDSHSISCLHNAPPGRNCNDVSSPPPAVLSSLSSIDDVFRDARASAYWVANVFTKSMDFATRFERVNLAMPSCPISHEMMLGSRVRIEAALNPSMVENPVDPLPASGFGFLSHGRQRPVA